MLNLTVTIDGIQVALDTRSDLENLHKFIGSYLCLTSQSAVSLPMSSLPQTDLVPTQRVTEPQSTTRNPFGGRNPGPNNTITAYIIRVLKEHPEGLTPIQIVDKMKQVGWITRSTKPLRLIQVRLYEDKVQFARTASGKWTMTDGALDSDRVVQTTIDDEQPL